MRFKLDIQFFGGRGASSSSGSRLFSRTAEQDKAIKRLAKRTANLKNEQYRIIDSDGNVVLEKKGSQHEVSATVGEKRQYLDGNISLHNHPSGGTFSGDDLNEFGFGAKEIVVSTPEGTYRLINKKYGTADQSSGWYDMRENLYKSVPEQSGLTLLKQARQNTSNTKTAKEMDAISKKWDSIRKSKGNDEAKKYLESTKDKYDSLSKKHKQEVDAEKRRLETQPFHDFYKANAKKYGFDYKFEKKGG